MGGEHAEDDTAAEKCRAGRYFIKDQPNPERTEEAFNEHDKADLRRTDVTGTGRDYPKAMGNSTKLKATNQPTPTVSTPSGPAKGTAINATIKPPIATEGIMLR